MATEIQKNIFVLGDYMSDGRAAVIMRDSTDFKSEEFFFVPRQDQLQDMLGPYPGNYVLFKRWTEELEFENGNPISKLQTFTSMEQLWLAFVMKDKYNKEWNGEDWVSNAE
jgi:hypothetical protein